MTFFYLLITSRFVGLPYVLSLGWFIKRISDRRFSIAPNMLFIVQIHLVHVNHDTSIRLIRSCIGPTLADLVTEDQSNGDRICDYACYLIIFNCVRILVIIYNQAFSDRLLQLLYKASANHRLLAINVVATLIVKSYVRTYLAYVPYILTYLHCYYVHSVVCTLYNCTCISFKILFLMWWLCPSSMFVVFT